MMMLRNFRHCLTRSLFGDSLSGFREIELIASRQQLLHCEVIEIVEYVVYPIRMLLPLLIFRKKYRAKEEKREIFLFSDVIILTKPPNKSSSPQYEIEKINFFLTSIFTENIVLVENGLL
jgi:hypothetical protein